MALGVLNNLSAIYAENNLNNTNSSLQTVLEQLSSGSRINSGADDAAGLSLVNGLAANSAALTQSETNATEGVGLLQVADGALSQVTNLLNRAITLATEASNGTLNNTQAAAANEEYQSILAEINNIGSTTTYNQQPVFGGTETAIYAGDSSTQGSSIDELNLRSLSESSVGDSNGVMSYTTGQKNVFLNLSTASANAQTSDLLNSTTGQTTLDVKYLVNGANGPQTTSSTQISVGRGTSYANTVEGLIEAINNAGLGLTATFATQAQAGVTGGGTQTGIEIAGGLISVGIDPSSVSTSGMLNADGIPASELLTQGQTLTVYQNGNQVAQVQISASCNTLSQLAQQINAQAGAGTATVITNGDGTQSLVLTDTSASDGALTATVQAGSGATIPVFGAAAAGTNAPSLTASGSSSGTQQVSGSYGSATFGASGTNASGDALSVGGQITINNAGTGASLTFVVGAGTSGSGTYYTNGSNTLGGLLALIQAQGSALGVTASLAAGNAGITVTATTAATGENISVSGNSLTQANNKLGLYQPTLGGTGVYATAVLQLDPTNPNLTTITDGNGGANGDQLTGSVTLTSNGITETFVQAAGSNVGSGNGAIIYTGGATINDLIGAINGQSAAGDLQLTATAPGGGTGGIYLQAGTTGAAYDIAMGTSTLADVGYTAGGDSQSENTVTTVNGRTAVIGVDSSILVGVGSASLSTSDLLTSGGALSITYNGTTAVFNVGGSGTADSTGTYYTANHGDASNSLANLATTINAANMGILAQATTSGLTLTSTAALGRTITVNSSSLSDATQGSYSNVTLGSFANENDTVTGTLTFAVGGNQKSVTLNAGSTVSSLISQINGTANIGVQATWAPTSNGFGNIVLTSTTEGTSGNITLPVAAIMDTTATADLTYTAAGAYSTGLTSDTTNVVYDSTSGQNATTAAATLVSNARSGSGIATTSYSDGAGQALNGTTLLTQADARTALNELNVAISDVAAQDGYIGAQINTLHSISQVMSTQQENMLSAQNAIQATDYASATSNMSKYEILTQTGIAALAQANSVEQEVTKLLQ